MLVVHCQPSALVLAFLFLKFGLMAALALPLTSRRSMLLAGATATATATSGAGFAAAAPQLVDYTAASTSSLCGDRLMVETVIPGAYQNPCMDESVRTIPIRATKELPDLRILQGSVGPGSTGAAVWNSSILLKRLVEEMDCWKDSSVFELGCGTGLVSLTIKALGASRVVATDGNTAVLERAAQSAQLNKLPLETATLSWGLLEAADYFDAADWVIGSDLTYSPGNWPALADTMAAIAKYRVLYLTLAHAGFSNEMDGFLTVASSRSGLVVDQEYTRSVRSILMDRCLLSAEERKLVQEGRGVNVVVLRRS